MLRHNSRNGFSYFWSNIFENCDQKSQNTWFFAKKSLFWHFLVKILKNIAWIKNLKKKKKVAR